MRFHSFYFELIGCKNSEEVFNYFLKTITDSITYWDYFVNWEKVFKNISDIELDLNTLNYLIGKENIEIEFKNLLTKQPSLITTIPILLAVRDKNFKILTNYVNYTLEHKAFSFNSYDLNQSVIDAACVFAKNTGILNLLENKKLKSIPDYVLGIEVGLDSNGRKNRHGDTMQEIVENYIKAICIKHNCSYINQANSKKLHKNVGKDLSASIKDRVFDFAVWKDPNKLVLIETNFYGGVGTKLKATAGEYRNLQQLISNNPGVSFIWITDGLGWPSTTTPLKQAFDDIDYTINIKMILSGLLEKIILENIK